MLLVRKLTANAGRPSGPSVRSVRVDGIFQNDLMTLSKVFTVPDIPGSSA